MDYLGEPYPELYQNAFLAGRLSTLDPLALAAAQGRNLSGAPGLPSGLMQYPPYIAAAWWAAQVSVTFSFHCPPLIILHFDPMQTLAAAWWAAQVSVTLHSIRLPTIDYVACRSQARGCRRFGS